MSIIFGGVSHFLWLCCEPGRRISTSTCYREGREGKGREAHIFIAAWAFLLGGSVEYIWEKGRFFWFFGHDLRSLTLFVITALGLRRGQIDTILSFFGSSLMFLIN